MTTPLNHAQSYMRLVSSQLAVLKDDVPETSILNATGRAFMAQSKRSQFAIVQEHEDAVQAIFTEALAAVQTAHSEVVS